MKKYDFFRALVLANGYAKNTTTKRILRRLVREAVEKAKDLHFEDLADDAANKRIAKELVP